jgi:4-amino-4-deoxy-L-arabinose transferase-like glycosyltransferase
MFRLLSPRLWLVLLWAVLVAVSLSVRPLFPVDETRYAAVAWEMWFRDDFLVPYLNGETYSHKPPLLFWLMQLSWWLFGVNDWSHRIVAPLFSLATLYLSQAVARALWPDRSQVAELTPFILLGFIFWMVYSTLTMFDIMLSFFALLGMYSLLKPIRSGLSLKYWGLLGIAIGGGVLSKGPVILLHVLPVAILAPWWLKTVDLSGARTSPEGVGAHNLKPTGFVGRQQTHFRWRYWYGGLVMAVLIGASIALCWAIPAGMSGGEAYRNAIFLGQTSGRLVDSFAHKLPFWWYLQLMPLLLLPWLLMKPFWTGLAKLDLRENGIRFCLAWALPVFVAFSLVSGKRIHYLLPLMPALALLLARAVDQLAEFNWQRTHVWLMSILGFLGLALALFPWLNAYFHWREELASVSSVWGVLLFICTAILGVLTTRKAKESVAYVCVASIVAALAITCGFFEVKGERYDTTPPAKKIAELMGEKRAIAFYGSKYHGQFHFAGRLNRPIAVIADYNALAKFAHQFPSGYILIEHKDLRGLLGSTLGYLYPFKGHDVGFISCKTLIDNPRLASVLKPS